jgi:flavin-dependent dehydrogenase
MNLRPSVENLVIGGGLAGSMTALRLAEAGREVLLIEREPSSGPKVCGEFLSIEAVSYLRQAGVDPLTLGAVPIQNLRLCCTNKTVETKLPFTALSVSRQVLDSALRRRAIHAGCIVSAGASVESLTRQDGKGVGAWTATIRTAHSSQSQTSAIIQNARNVFLATGKHDLRGWARPAGRQNDLVGFKMHWRLTPAQTESLRGWMDLFLFRGGYGGLAIVENGVANLCLVVRRSNLPRTGAWEGILAELCRESPHMAARLESAQTLWQRPMAISSIPYGYLAGRSSPAWCVGDQAAVIPSFTGDGMSIALHSAALAADMHLAGKTTIQYDQTLRSQLNKGISLATMLSRTMVTPAGRFLAPLGLAVLPNAMSWIAQLTRIPERALLAGQKAFA